MSDDDLAAIASLAEPVRRLLYRYVVAQSEPVSRDQAAAGVGVPRHVAKFHLDRLVDDGLLDVGHRRAPDRRGPGAGRPANVYRASSRQIEVTLPERRYELGGRLLAQAVTEADRDGVPVRTAVDNAATEAGRTLGKEARRRAGRRPSRRKLLASATEVLEELGYTPRRDAGATSLGNCPFAALARDYTELVCGMNLALVDGLVDGLGLDRVDATLDPAPGRCCVRLVERR